MSVSNSIDICIKNIGSRLEMVKVFFENEWTPSYQGRITFLPFGDKDEFDWQSEDISIDSLYAILKEKEDAGEMLGIIIIWKDSMIGGQLLLFNDKSISFNPNINTKLCNDYEELNLLDYNWYLPKLIAPLSSLDIHIESIKTERI